MQKNILTSLKKQQDLMHAEYRSIFGVDSRDGFVLFL